MKKRTKKRPPSKKKLQAKAQHKMKPPRAREQADSRYARRKRKNLWREVEERRKKMYPPHGDIPALQLPPGHDYVRGRKGRDGDIPDPDEWTRQRRALIEARRNKRYPGMPDDPGLLYADAEIRRVLNERYVPPRKKDRCAEIIGEIYGALEELRSLVNAS